MENNKLGSCIKNNCEMCKVGTELFMEAYLFDSDTKEMYNSESWILLIVLDGYLRIDLPGLDSVNIGSNQMLLIPIHHKVLSFAEKGTFVIKCSFYNTNEFHMIKQLNDSFILENTPDTRLNVLSVKRELNTFTSLLRSIYFDGINCIELNTLLVKELLILLRSYYNA
ncbi:MAG: hypothetical protein ACRCX5_00845, partial [Bacteroidales bacterium]